SFAPACEHAMNFDGVGRLAAGGRVRKKNQLGRGDGCADGNLVRPTAKDILEAHQRLYGLISGGSAVGVEIGGEDGCRAEAGRRLISANVRIVSAGVSVRAFAE